MTLIALSLSCQAKRTYHDLGRVEPGTYLLDTLQGKCLIEATVKMGKKPAEWGLIYGYDTAYFRARFIPEILHPGTAYEHRRTRLIICHGDSVISEQELGLPKIYNTLSINLGLTAPGEVTYKAELPAEATKLTGFYTTAPAEVANFVVETELEVEIPETISLEKATYWDYYDRENDPDYARMGGRYRLATVPCPGGYYIAYVAGGEVNSDFWKPGMVKGTMKLSPLGDYDLTWVTSMGQQMTQDLSARIEGDLLTLEFPLYRTRLRFVRVRR